LGVEAPETLDALASLAWVEEELDKDNNAREHYTAVFEGRIKHPKFGRDHPETLDALAQLAWLHEKGHDFGGAAEKYREVWEKRKAHPNYGPEHKGTLWALDRLADCEDSQGKFQEAEPHRRELHEANQARVNSLGKDDIEALNTLADYTNTLSRLGQGDQAIKLATELVERARRLLGKNDDWTQQIEKVLSSLKKMFPQATR
jgi:tetratricopeptide (TPR) repeat protein